MDKWFEPVAKHSAVQANERGLREGRLTPQQQEGEGEGADEGGEGEAEAEEEAGGGGGD